MTSDSSDEENLDLLKEAQDSQFINDSMFSDSPENQKRKLLEDNNKSLPSLRKTTDDDDQFNFLKVTPEFRNYVAKQLSSILDRKLTKKFADLEAPQLPKKKRKRGGVKLLSDSSHFLKVTQSDCNTSNQIHNAKAKLVKRYNGNDKDITEEALKQVAVTPEDILSKKEVKNWSKRSKAPVCHYKKTKNGQLELIES